MALQIKLNNILYFVVVSCLLIGACKQRKTNNSMMYDFEIHYLLMQSSNSYKDSLPVSKINVERMCHELLGRLTQDINIVKENSEGINNLYNISTMQTCDIEMNTQATILKGILARSAEDKITFSDIEYIYIQYLKSKFLFKYPESWFLQKDIIFSYEILNKYLREFADDINNIYRNDLDYISSFYFYNKEIYLHYDSRSERLYYSIERRKIIEVRDILKKALTSEKDNDLKQEISKMLTIFNAAAQDDCLLIFCKTP